MDGGALFSSWFPVRRRTRLWSCRTICTNALFAISYGASRHLFSLHLYTSAFFLKPAPGNHHGKRMTVPRSTKSFINFSLLVKYGVQSRRKLNIRPLSWATCATSMASSVSAIIGSSRHIGAIRYPDASLANHTSGVYSGTLLESKGQLTHWLRCFMKSCGVSMHSSCRLAFSSIGSYR
ncbi:hypothetical protein EI94DRAFT_881358 [Lactarius quietus]|nr:hypothetical protein EI94DRAFT_881358 [Lactarius quietus]